MIKQFALAASLAMAVAASAQAAVHTYGFSATITSVQLVTGPWGGPEVPSAVGPDGVSIVKVGDAIVGRFSFDDAVVPTAWEDWQSAWFRYESGVTLSYTFVNTGATSSLGADITVVDRTMDFWPDDDFVVTSTNYDGAQLRFYDVSNTLFTAGLPTRPFTRADLSGATMGEAWHLADGQLVGYNANVNSVSLLPAPVPEPATWALLLGGLALVGGAARRVRR